MHRDRRLQMSCTYDEPHEGCNDITHKIQRLESENRRLREAVKYADQLIIYWQNMEDDELPDGSIIDWAYDDWIKAKSALHPTDTEKGRDSK